MMLVAEIKRKYRSSEPWVTSVSQRVTFKYVVSIEAVVYIREGPFQPFILTVLT